MRQLMTSALLSLAVSAGAALPAAASDTARECAVRERSGAPRTYQGRPAEGRGHQHLAYHARWQRSDEDAARPRLRRAHAATHGRRAAGHAGAARRTANPSLSKKSIGTVAPRGGGQQGLASFYSERQRLASGGWFNPNALTAAHRSLPFGTRVRVTHRGSGRSVDVTINDRGPYIAGRIIDLSRAAASAIGMTAQPIAKVTVEVLGR
jgi:rare lipoprotein A